MNTKPRWQSTTILAVLVGVVANVLAQSNIITLDEWLQTDIVNRIMGAVTVISGAVAIYWRIKSVKKVTLK